MSIKISGSRFAAEGGEAFTPIGVNYFRAGTGWPPKFWMSFDEDLIRSDFMRLKDLGFNCARVFLTYESFYREAGRLNAEGVRKFNVLLKISEQTGVFIHPTGLDHWEGLPGWAKDSSRYCDELHMRAVEDFWRLFVPMLKGNPRIFAYDLLNEPSIRCNSSSLLSKWGGPMPEPDSQEWILFEKFRENLAESWTKRQVEAIKACDPDALVTVGLIQWSVKEQLGEAKDYSGFDPYQIGRHLDFMEIHFYPVRPPLKYMEGQMDENIAYLLKVLKATKQEGKPLVLGEFGWYGGGAFQDYPYACEEKQSEWCKTLIEQSGGLCDGWLNWSAYDCPEANDVSVLSGIFRQDGTLKKWGADFSAIAKLEPSASY